MWWSGVGVVCQVIFASNSTKVMLGWGWVELGWCLTEEGEIRMEDGDLRLNKGDLRWDDREWRIENSKLRSVGFELWMNNQNSWISSCHTNISAHSLSRITLLLSSYEFSAWGLFLGLGVYLILYNGIIVERLLSLWQMLHGCGHGHICLCQAGIVRI